MSTREGIGSPENYLHRQEPGRGKWHRWQAAFPAPWDHLTACGLLLLDGCELWAINIMPPADELCRHCFPWDAAGATEGLSRRPKIPTN